MAAGAWLLAFTAGVAVSLAASWLLVSRLERLGERAGFPEAPRSAHDKCCKHQ